MKALLIILLASLVYVPEVQAQSNDTPVVREYNETRIQRSNRDRRHWRDRVEDLDGRYIERNNDGGVIYEVRPYVNPGRPRAEANCKYVERIDFHGQRSFHFVCP